ncbi:hypothetical protein ACVBIL_18400 [Shewanella sp. 125m-7]
MNLKPLAITIVTSCLTLSQPAYSAPTDIQVIDKKEHSLTTKINTDENDITHVTTLFNDISYEMSFTPQELADKDSIKQKVSKLPEDAQQPVTRMLERVPFHPATPKLLLDPKVSQAIKIKLEKLHQQLNGKEADIKAHAMKLESKAIILERKAHELEVLFEQNEGEFEIHVQSLGDDIALLTEQITELELERLGLDGDASRVLIFQGDDEPSSSDIMALIERAELTYEEKQKLSEALSQK